MKVFKTIEVANTNIVVTFSKQSNYISIALIVVIINRLNIQRTVRFLSEKSNCWKSLNISFIVCLLTLLG